MAKPVKSIIKLQIKAGQATPGPPVGTALGPHGINIQDFVKKFNNATKDKGDYVIPVEMTIYEDRTFDLAFKTPPASDMIRKAAGVDKGSGEPHSKKVGKITKAQVKEIAEKKMEDISAHDIDQAMKIIEGTARSMGITVE
jgi:large subunit ribosomal protein L11